MIEKANNIAINIKKFRELVNLLYSKKIIKLNDKIIALYLYNICNGYIHIENKPSLLVSGISLNVTYVHKLYDLLEQLEKNE